MFTFKTKVSYSRVDRNGNVPLYEIMNYFQDCTTFQSEELGAGIGFMEKRQRAWIIVAYKIQINQQIKLGQDICVGTAPTQFKGMLAYRNYVIKDSEGNKLVQADSLWILMDMQNRKPTRITEADTAMYKIEEGFENLKANRKIYFEGEKKAFPPFKVLKTYIDNNGHMNNAEYLRVAQEFLPANQNWKSLNIVYNKEAMEGEEIVPYIYEESDGIGICFESVTGEILTKIKLQSED